MREVKEIIKCRSCGADIRFIKTENSKYMPCEPEAVNYWAHRYGGTYIIKENGQMVYCTINEPHPVIMQNCDKSKTQSPKPDGKGYIPHWNKCKKGEQKK